MSAGHPVSGGRAKEGKIARSLQLQCLRISFFFIPAVAAVVFGAAVLLGVPCFVL